MRGAVYTIPRLVGQGEGIVSIVISKGTETKLKEKHSVDLKEVEQCFENRTGTLLKDLREDHQSDPPTLWFLALTNRNRLLKVCFIQRGADQHIRTVYAPNDTEIRIYKALAKPTDF